MLAVELEVWRSVRVRNAQTLRQLTVRLWVPADRDTWQETASTRRQTVLPRAAWRRRPRRSRAQRWARTTCLCVEVCRTVHPSEERHRRRGRPAAEQNRSSEFNLGSPWDSLMTCARSRQKIWREFALQLPSARLSPFIANYCTSRARRFRRLKMSNLPPLTGDFIPLIASGTPPAADAAPVLQVRVCAQMEHHTAVFSKQVLKKCSKYRLSIPISFCLYNPPV